MVKVITDKKRIAELLNLGVAEVVVRKDLEEKLKSGRVLRVKHGIDPTSKDLHLGYGAVYHKLKEFQDLGHKIVFLIGGFTGRFGDPTDKEKGRDLRKAGEVKSNAKDYLKQLGRILDIDKVELRDNSEWYDKWSFEDGLRLLSKFTVARMLERDMFKERIKKGREVNFHEPVYPMLQGWDSVELKSDLTVIGMDQKFNELQARALQQNQGQAPQDLVSVPLLVGTDGKQKMSQSLGNDIGLTARPAEQFGKIMSIPDQLILPYFELAARYKSNELTRVKKELAQGRNPKELKVELGKAVVAMYHSAPAADKAAQEFAKVFGKKEIPTDIKQIKLKKTKYLLPDLLTTCGLADSKSAARRLVEQGGVKINNSKITNWGKFINIKSGDVLQVGKRKYIKIK